MLIIFIMDPILLISFCAGTLTLFYSAYLILQISALPTGDKKMQSIALAISQGANAYLARQNKTVAVVAGILALVLALTISPFSAFSFIIGAAASALAGYIGMSVAVKANVRCTQAAKDGMSAALAVAFRGGTVTGLMVGSLALLSLVGIILLANMLGIDFEQPLVSLGFGGSIISVFARLGGGIYTKGADVGTDMVGKIERGIPEDDPRNPGVIADLVGDNVGDDAGMAADLFETYVVTTVAAILLGRLVFPQNDATHLFPMIIGSIALIASILGTFFVRIGSDGRIMPALYKGLVATTVFAVIGFVYYALNMTPNLPGVSEQAILINFIVGIVVTFGMVIITEYYTGKTSKTVKSLAEASLSGSGTNVIAGLALSMKSTLPAVLLLAVSMLISFNAMGLYGVAIAAVSMLSLTGIIVAIDAFGPITDNAGGIAEMSNQKPEVRKITDALDAVGNTTKAVTKAYAIGSAGLAALVLFATYTEELRRFGSGTNSIGFSLSDPYVLVGLFIGGSLPYFFGGLAMEAVGKAAMAVVVEIRRQFKEIKGIMSGKARPDYAQCVDIVTKTALKEMVVPATIPVVVPILVGFLLGSKALGGLLMGIIITGLFVAISMTTGGAAWDNAKKYIEDGHYGGKGGVAHAAAVTGDTVGDPYKDTAGPAINPMIKVANIVALLLAPFLA